MYVDIPFFLKLKMLFVKLAMMTRTYFSYNLLKEMTSQTKSSK